MNFQPGDIVKLKCETINMVVQYIDGNGLVNCIWYSKLEDKYKSENFYSQTLIKVN